MRVNQAVVDELVRDPEFVRQVEEGQELMRGVLERSSTDGVFRQLLLTEPKQAIAAYSTEHGKRIADEVLNAVSIRFVEPQGAATFVLPPRAGTDAELSAEELESVSGGVTPAIVASALFGSGVILGVSVVISAYYAIKAIAK